MKSYLTAVFLALAVILLEVQIASLSPFMNENFESFGLFQSGLNKREAIETDFEEMAVNMENQQPEINPVQREERNADLALAAVGASSGKLEEVSGSLQQPNESQGQDAAKISKIADLVAPGVKGAKTEGEQQPKEIQQQDNQQREAKSEGQSEGEQQPKENQQQDNQQREARDVESVAAPVEAVAKEMLNTPQKAVGDAGLAALGVKGAKTEGGSAGEQQPKENQQQPQREARDVESAAAAAEEQPIEKEMLNVPQRAERDADLAVLGVKGAKQEEGSGAEQQP